MAKNQQELPLNHEVLLARDVVAAFLKAIKNFELYPHDHAIAQNLLKSIHSRLDNFLVKFGGLKISIEQRRLLYKSVLIYEAGSPPEDNLAFILYRDGLLWVEFLPGLSIEEIVKFFSIIHKYKVLHDEPEEDIVTALWDEDMPHIAYEAKELFFEETPLIDFANLNRNQGRSSEPSGGNDSETSQSANSSSIMDLLQEEGRQRWWSLSVEENNTLKEMVREAEKSVCDGDVIKVLFFVLSKQNNEEAFGVVLHFLKEEWRFETEAGNFLLVTNQLTVLKEQAESPQPGREWVSDLLKKFFAEISGEDILSSLSPVLAKVNGENQNQLARFRKLLLLLEPEALVGLVKLLPKVRDQEVYEVIFEVTVKLADKDMSYLNVLLASDDEPVVTAAIKIAGTTREKWGAELVCRALQHSSPQVRRVALGIYLTLGDPDIKMVATFIDDPDITTRAMAFSFLGRERSEMVEKMLLSYLENNSFRHKDEDHINACFRALGRCGSSRSLPFLEKTILGIGWKSLLDNNKSIQIHGAVTALAELQNKEAMSILKRGSESLVPAIRQSCRNALMNKSGGHNGNGF